MTYLSHQLYKVRFTLQDKAAMRFPFMLLLITSVIGLCGMPSKMIAQQVTNFSQRRSSQTILPFDTEIRQGIEYIYNLEFEKADNLFVTINKDHNNPAGKFFIGMVTWWKIMMDIDNTSLDEQFSNQMDEVIDLCDERLERDDRDIQALFFKCAALGFRGRLRANRGSWLKAANDGKDALPLISKIRKLDDANYDMQFGLGLYNYYAEAVPDKFPATKPLTIFFPKGNKKEGIRQLELAADSARYAAAESLYFLLQIHYVYEKNFNKAIEYAKRLHNRFPNNPFFYAYLGRCFYAGGFWKEAETLYFDILQKAKSKSLYTSARWEREAHYYIGLIKMHQRNNAESFAHFINAYQLEKQVEPTEGEPSAFYTLTHLRLGMLYDLQGNRQKALEHYKVVLNTKDYNNAQQHAKNYMNSPYTGAALDQTSNSQ
ncbi:MAG: tetratricopeptide repeat protein [Chloroherpetonaceae bacterium]|nr:tetratricopeptide repeat protein [Chloroherpetonaceae bacterium]